LKLFVALSLSLLIHLGILIYLQETKIEYNTQQNLTNNTSKTTSINYVKLKPQQKVIPKNINKKQIKPKIIKKPIEKKKLEKVVEKPLIKKPIVKKEISKPKKIAKIIKKPIPKNSPPKIEQKEILTPEQKEYKKLQDEITPLTKEYTDLYEDFEKMPNKTKIFILKNIGTIGEITQRHLFYPSMSIQASQEGVNVVEFMLFENGNISTPKIIKSSSYFLLDDNTIETIQAAYIDYPRPQKPTPIRIFVKYKLIRE
jgi:TonB family protein